MKNEPAFPNPQLLHANGMTLRDYFAAKAMPFVKGLTADDVAKNAYEMADAMLKAREEGK